MVTIIAVSGRLAGQDERLRLSQIVTVSCGWSRGMLTDMVASDRS